MPVARPQISPVAPAPLTDEEATFIADTVKQFFGEDVVLRNYGPTPDRIEIHVETDREVGMEKHDCLGILITRIDRQISLDFTKRGERVFGNA
jgi:hypothetical protein